MLQQQAWAFPKVERFLYTTQHDSKKVLISRGEMQMAYAQVPGTQATHRHQYPLLYTNNL